VAVVSGEYIRTCCAKQSLHSQISSHGNET
jgi:hypothetical protein